MKNVFKYLMAVLACVLVSTAFVACEEDDEFGSADLGLGIKVFAPTHVVAGVPMTINGSGFGEATEIEFPGGVKVTSFEVVTNEMLRVVAPAGISAEGGKIIVRNSKGESAESRLALTIGKTVVSGFSKQPGEELKGLEEITVYGQDLQFIEKAELLDEEGNPLFVPQKDFTRLAQNKAIVKIPNNIFTGTFVGKLWTFDGQSFELPELAYEPTITGGHWETTKRYLWKNDGSVGAASWADGSPYRFSSAERSTGEEVYAFPMEDWDIIKNGEFKVDIEATAPTIRILDAWWSGPKYTEEDIQVGHNLLIDNGDGTMTFTVKLAGLELQNTIDEKHLLFAGDAFTILAIYTEEEVWIGGEEGHFERVSLWKNDGSVGAASWADGSPYRFSSAERSTGEEVYAFPMKDWDIIKNGEFKVDIEATAPTIRILDAWWSGPKYTEEDIQVGHKLLIDNGDGTMTFTVKLAGLELQNTIDEKHLLFAGDAFTIKEIYVEKWVDGGDGGPKEIVLWEGEAVADDWGNQPYMLSDGGAELAEAGAHAGQILCFYITPTEENWNLQIVEGHWSGVTYVDANQSNWDLAEHNGAVELELTDEILATALTQQWWGGSFILNGDNVVCTKVTLK